MGTAICRDARLDRDRTAAVPGYLASSLRQDRTIVERAGPRGTRRVLRRAGGCRRLRARDPGRISLLHRPAVRALRRGGRRSHHRQSVRHAAGQHDVACDRHIDRQRRRHHRRRHDPDPPAAQGERRPRSQCPRCGLFHRPGRQYRRRALAARRSAVVRRLPARRGILLAAETYLASDAHRGRATPRGVPRARHMALAQRTHAQQRADRHSDPRPRQLRADRTHHRGHPRLGGLETRHHVQHLWHRDRVAEHPA
jgi:hypothetical protein